MKKEIFYQHNYYDLSRKVKDDTVISLLNNKELLNLIQPYLSTLLDKIYLSITTKDNYTDFETIAKGCEPLNEKIIIILSNCEAFLKVEDQNISSNLFSSAFIKLCRRIFLKDGFNDEKYFIQTQVHEWLEYNLADAVFSDNRFKSFTIIRVLLNQLELLHHFYSSFIENFPAAWLSSEINSWTNNDGNIINILEPLRTYEKDYFIGYVENLDKINKLSRFEYTIESTRFSDYAFFNDEFSFKSSVLIKKDINNWLLFWDNLKWPILQNVAFHYIRNPETILEIIKKVVEQKESVKSDLKVLSFMLLRNLFDGAVKTSENLSFYEDEQRIQSLSKYERHDDIIIEGKRILALWDNELYDNFSTAIHVLSSILSPDEISEWVFSYSTKAESFSKINIYNGIVDVLLKSYDSFYLSKPILFDSKHLSENFNLQKFNFLISKIEKFNDPNNIAEDLINHLVTYLSTDSFYWDYSFSGIYWDTIKSIGRALSYLNNPVLYSKELLSNTIVFHEGWNINHNDYKVDRKESFIICGIIVLLEHPKAFKNKDEKIVFFEFLTNTVLCQTRFVIHNFNSGYLNPLRLLGIAAIKIFSQKQRVHFINQLLSQCDSFELVINILSESSFSLSKKNKLILEKRIKTEFYLYRKLHLQRKMMDMVGLIEKQIEVLLK